MKKALVIYNKLKPYLQIILYLLFIGIAANAILSTSSLIMKGFIAVFSVIVLAITIYYDYLKRQYYELQKALIMSESVIATQTLRDGFIKKDTFKGFKDSILLFDVLFSLDNNQPELTLQLLEENDRFFRSSLDMLLVKKYSAFKAYTLLENRSQSKKAYDELVKLRETNLNKSKKMNLLYNWDQIEALNLGFNLHKYSQALKLYNQVNTSKMNNRELLHLNVEKRWIGKQLNEVNVINEANLAINSISIDSPFKESI